MCIRDRVTAVQIKRISIEQFSYLISKWPSSDRPGNNASVVQSDCYDDYCVTYYWNKVTFIDVCMSYCIRVPLLIS